MRAGAGRRCGRLRCLMGMAAPRPAGNAAGREGAVGRCGGTDRRAGTLRARLRRRAGAADASRRAARDGTSGRWGEERGEDRARSAPSRAARAYGNSERRWRVVPRARRAAAGGSGRRADRGHEGGLSALGSRLSALGSRLSALGSRLSLSRLSARLSALALGSRLSALGSRLSALGSRLSALIYLCRARRPRPDRHRPAPAPRHPAVPSHPKPQPPRAQRSPPAGPFNHQPPTTCPSPLTWCQHRN